MESHLDTDGEDAVHSEKHFLVSYFLELVEHGKNDLFLQIESVKKLLGVK
jgi:hypothetical protein